VLSKFPDPTPLQLFDRIYEKEKRMKSFSFENYIIHNLIFCKSRERGLTLTDYSALLQYSMKTRTKKKEDINYHTRINHFSLEKRAAPDRKIFVAIFLLSYHKINPKNFQNKNISGFNS